MTNAVAEKKLAVDSLTVRRAMNLDCLRITSGSRKEHYRRVIAAIDAELAKLATEAAR